MAGLRNRKTKTEKMGGICYGLNRTTKHLIWRNPS